jgi:hypothetical protein
MTIKLMLESAVFSALKPENMTHPHLTRSPSAESTP